MITDAKKYKICMVVSMATNLSGLLLMGLDGPIGEILFVISIVTGLACGTFRLAKDLFAKAFPKKEKSGFVIAALPILIFIWYFKFMWAAVKFMFCFVYPFLVTFISTPIAYFKYKNELI